MPITHIGLLTNDIDTMSDLYLAALKPLGYKLFQSIENGAVRGYAATGSGPDFWLASTKGQEDRVPKSAEVTEVLNKHHNGHVGKPTGPLHITFHTTTRAQVCAFHKAAL
ncbi:hypothetical protein AX16_009101 [Volvariella volvacea WC 439]|nr:hypothetical protein AX16_009101 [Volvariella volvacea WC 439]